MVYACAEKEHKVWVPQMGQHGYFMHKIRTRRCQCPPCFIIAWPLKGLCYCKHPPPARLIYLGALALANFFEYPHLLLGSHRQTNA